MTAPGTPAAPAPAFSAARVAADVAALYAAGEPTVVLLDGPHRRYARTLPDRRVRAMVDVGGVRLALDDAAPGGEG